MRRPLKWRAGCHGRLVQPCVLRTTKPKRISIKSLELLKLLPETPQRTQQEFVLRTTLALTLQAIRGYGSPEVEQAYAGVRARVGEVQSRAHLMRILFGLCQLHLTRAEYETALEVGQQLLGIAEEE